jgi:hypothetical protein
LLGSKIAHANYFRFYHEAVAFFHQHHLIDTDQTIFLKVLMSHPDDFEVVLTRTYTKLLRFFQADP